MDDIQHAIFTLLPFRDMYIYSLVNKQLNNISKNESLWKHIYYNNVKYFDVVDNYYNTCKIYFSIAYLQKVISPCNIKSYNNFYRVDLEYLRKKSIFKSKGMQTYKNFIPNEICVLKNLEFLSCINNSITYIPTHIGLLTNLKELYFGGNEIQIIPTTIGNLINLVIFDISHNAIENIPTEIEKLTNLEELYFVGNKIQSIPTEISNLTNLTILEI